MSRATLKVCGTSLSVVGLMVLFPPNVLIASTIEQGVERFAAEWPSAAIKFSVGSDDSDLFGDERSDSARGWLATLESDSLEVGQAVEDDREKNNQSNGSNDKEQDASQAKKKKRERKSSEPEQKTPSNTEKNDNRTEATPGDPVGSNDKKPDGKTTAKSPTNNTKAERSEVSKSGQGTTDSAAEKKLATGEKTDGSSPEGARPAAAATVEVKRRPLKIETTLDGVFEAQQMAELVLRPVEWQGLTVVEAVEHGKEVRRGDVIVMLDLEKIDRALADLRTELRTTELTLRQAEEELRALEALTPIDIAAAERSLRQTQEDFRLYREVLRPMSLRSAKMMLALSEFRLQNAKEELEQLEKMYKADDLTEETEEIVLKRAKMQLEVAQFNHEVAKIQYEDAVERDIPRNDARIEDNAKRADIAWRRTQVLTPAALEKQRLEVEKLKTSRQRAEERFAKLSADREQMIVRAPIDGVVYYGTCERGKWGSSLGDRLQRGATLQPHKVFATIVQSRPLAFRANVVEKHFANVRPGMKVSIKPAIDPNARIEGIVERVASVPHGSGLFDARITLAEAQIVPTLMPGMSGEAKVLTYEKSDALTVPVSSLAADENDDRKQFVYVLIDGKPTKQPVEVGRKTDRWAEILAGIEVGTRVLVEPPKESSAEGAAQKSPPSRAASTEKP